MLLLSTTILKKFTLLIISCHTVWSRVRGLSLTDGGSIAQGWKERLKRLDFPWKYASKKWTGRCPLQKGHTYIQQPFFTVIPPNWDLGRILGSTWVVYLVDCHAFTWQVLWTFFEKYKPNIHISCALKKISTTTHLDPFYKLLQILIFKIPFEVWTPPTSLLNVKCTLQVL